MPPNYQKIDESIAERKERFLSSYTESRGLLYMACKASGVDVKDVTEWKRMDQGFNDRMVMVERLWTDEVASRLYDKTINDKKSQGNMLAIIYTLKHKHPDFAENQQYLEAPRPLWFGSGDKPVLDIPNAPILDNKSDNTSSDSIHIKESDA